MHMRDFFALNLSMVLILDGRSECGAHELDGWGNSICYHLQQQLNENKGWFYLHVRSMFGATIWYCTMNLTEIHSLVKLIRRFVRGVEPSLIRDLVYDWLARAVHCTAHHCHTEKVSTLKMKIILGKPKKILSLVAVGVRAWPLKKITFFSRLLYEWDQVFLDI